MGGVKHLRLLAGAILLALALILGGCGGDQQEEQQDVEEARDEQTEG